MSNAGRFTDRNPALRPAGLVTAIKDESAQNAFNHSVPDASTPPHIKKFRKSFNEEPGAKVTHYGVADDSLPPSHFTYGKKTLFSDHVNELMGYQRLNGIAEFENQVKEQKYASTRNEPLGKSMQRDYKFPQQVQNPDFKFGVGNIFEEPAKVIIMPPDGKSDEDPDTKNLYYRSHGSTDAGEQIKRNYNWNLDKDQHRFGRPVPKQPNGVGQCLNSDTFSSNNPKSTIVKKTVEDFKFTNDDELGKPKNLRTGKPPVKEDHTFGISTKPSGEWNVPKCIVGEPSERELQPEPNLGVSTRLGFRNVPKPGDEGRHFGVPTIRKDIPYKKERSLADTYNYGDEPNAGQVMFPEFWLRCGVSAEEFVKPMPHEEIQELFESIGMQFKKGKFQALVNKAFELHGVLCIQSFVNAIKWYEDRGLS